MGKLTRKPPGSITILAKIFYSHTWISKSRPISHRERRISSRFNIHCGGGGREVLRFLYGEFVETDCILILPSYGFTSRLIEDGWGADAVVNHIASRWCEAIQALLDRFPGYELKMKLHPGSQHDPLWARITENIKMRIPALIMMPPEESAEWLVAQSRVIVGDVTTVLWWAGVYGGKVVISLDVFGYPGGDEMRLYPNLIAYLANLSGIHELSSEFSKACMPEAAPLSDNLSTVMS